MIFYDLHLPALILYWNEISFRIFRMNFRFRTEWDCNSILELDFLNPRKTSNFQYEFIDILVFLSIPSNRETMWISNILCYFELSLRFILIIFYDIHLTGVTLYWNEFASQISARGSSQKSLFKFQLELSIWDWI